MGTRPSEDGRVAKRGAVESNRGMASRALDQTCVADRMACRTRGAPDTLPLLFSVALPARRCFVCADEGPVTVMDVGRPRELRGVARRTIRIAIVPGFVATNAFRALYRHLVEVISLGIHVVARGTTRLRMLICQGECLDVLLVAFLTAWRWDLVPVEVMAVGAPQRLVAAEKHLVITRCLERGLAPRLHIVTPGALQFPTMRDSPVTGLTARIRKYVRIRVALDAPQRCMST